LTVSILLSTYNGAKYLQEQLESLVQQTYKDFEIIVRDDGSTDNTLEILENYNITLLKSTENVGIKQSFSLLLEYALQNTESDYFMFCDQDDIWKSDKVEKTLSAMMKLEKEKVSIPLLVHTDLEIVTQNLEPLHSSFWNYENINPKYNSLNRILMHNTITGCTAMINRKLAILAVPMGSNIIMHDWWIGLIASYFGNIFYIDEQLIQYRQHDTNNIGVSKSKIRYLSKFFNRSNILSKYILQAKEFLQKYKNYLDKQTIDMLEAFISLESQSFFSRRRTLFKYKFFKQGIIKNLGLLVKM